MKLFQKLANGEKLKLIDLILSADNMSDNWNYIRKIINIINYC